MGPLKREDRLTLQQKLQTEYLSGAWTTYQEAAARHGVPVSVISSVMRKVKLGIAETIKQQRETEVERTLAQIERVIGKASEAFEISRRKKIVCPACKGTGRIEKRGCNQCEGDGWVTEIQPGDPAYLAIILRALEQKQKIFGMWPQKPTEVKQMLLIDNRDNPLMGAPPDILIRARRLVLEAKKGLMEKEDFSDTINEDRSGSQERGP